VFWNYTSVVRSFLKSIQTALKLPAVDGDGWETLTRTGAKPVPTSGSRIRRVVSYVFRSNVFTNEQLKPESDRTLRVCVRMRACVGRCRCRVKRLSARSFRDDDINFLHKFARLPDWVNLSLRVGERAKDILTYDGCAINYDYSIGVLYCFIKRFKCTWLVFGCFNQRNLWEQPWDDISKKKKSINAHILVSYKLRNFNKQSKNDKIMFFLK